MKTIKAWAVFDEKNEIVLSQRFFGTEGQIFPTAIGEYWEPIPEVSIPLPKGWVVKPITITWEEK